MSRQEQERVCRTPIEESVVERLRPTRLERIAASRIAGMVSSIVSRAVREAGYSDAVVTVEGSYAKDTWLPGDLDIDVFILLPRSVCLEAIESGRLLDHVKRVLARMFPVEDRHAQHPYIRVNVMGVWVEVVPGCVMRPGEKPLTPVDRTPLHREYVTRMLSPEARDEVRLLKAFMKTIGVYGAEIAVEGFSGYLVELLVSYYKCFRRVIEAASRWKPPVVIDPTGRHRVEELRRRFRGSPLVVVDPVDPSRNAAAAVSIKSLATFITASRVYLEKPSPFFFNYSAGRLCSVERLAVMVKDRRIVVVEFRFNRWIPPDNAWGMVKKAARNAASLLDRLGFNVVDYSAYYDEASGKGYAAVEVLHNPLPALEKHMGPPAWSGENTLKFIEKYLGGIAGPWIGYDGRLYTLRARRHRWAEEALLSRLSEWLPGSLRGVEVTAYRLEEDSVSRLSGVCEWLEQFVEKTPRWLSVLRLGRQ